MTEFEDRVTFDGLNEIAQVKIEVEDIDIKSKLVFEESNVCYVKEEPVISFQCNKKDGCLNNTLTGEILVGGLEADIKPTQLAVEYLENENLNHDQALVVNKVEQLEENSHNVNQHVKELSVVLFREDLELKESPMISERYVWLFIHIFVLFKFTSIFT